MSKPRNPLIPYVLNADYEDDVLMVWDLLTRTKESLVSSVIAEETGVDLGRVAHVLNALFNANVVVKETLENERSKAYRLAETLDTISWVMALELGIPEAQLGKHVKIEETEIDIYTLNKGKDISDLVEAVREVHKKEKEKSRKLMLAEKAQRDLASSDVTKILDDLRFLFNTVDANDPLANYIVETQKAFIEAQKALNRHLENKYAISRG